MTNPTNASQPPERQPVDITQYTAEDLANIEKYATEAEAGYTPDNLRSRGRPRLGPAARSVVVPIRVTPAVAAALDARSAARHLTRSEIARELLEDGLDQASAA
jgi:hypothetical protein